MGFLKHILTKLPFSTSLTTDLGNRCCTEKHFVSLETLLFYVVQKGGPGNEIVRKGT